MIFENICSFLFVVQELFKALEKNNWSMDKAVEALSKADSKDKKEADIIGNTVIFI